MMKNVGNLAKFSTFIFDYQQVTNIIAMITKDKIFRKLKELQRFFVLQMIFARNSRDMLQ
jgi:hypothetical protein